MLDLARATRPLQIPNPSKPDSRYRARHLSTVAVVTPRRCAVTLFAVPSAAARTIRACTPNPARTEVERQADELGAITTTKN